MTTDRSRILPLTVPALGSTRPSLSFWCESRHVQSISDSTLHQEKPRVAANSPFQRNALWLLSNSILACGASELNVLRNLSKLSLRLLRSANMGARQSAVDHYRQFNPKRATLSSKRNPS